MRAAVSLALALGLFAVGCGSRGDDDPGTYDRIELEPEVATLTVPLGGTGVQDYVVYGIAPDGSRRDITAQCALAIDTTFGTVSAATVTVSARGGKTDVVATCDALTANGVLIVNLIGEFVAPGAPANAAELFENATAGSDPARLPAIEYPFDKAVSPRNIPPVETQYTRGGNDLFHVTLQSSFANIHYYTTAAEAMLGEADWAAVAQTAAGENLTFSVEGLLQADPATKFVSTPVIVTMSNDAIDQTAIYWWASSQGSIMSQTFGSIDTPDLVRDNCTSCHSVSRAGTRIGYSRCVAGSCASQNLAVGFMKYDGTTNTWAEIVNADSLSILGSYTTFAPVGNPFPDDSQSVAIVNLLGGTFALYDPDTGAQVPSNLAVANAGGTKGAIMPDWSADGTKVVYTQAQPGQYIDLSGGRLATMSYAYTNGAHTFGDPQVIVPDPIALPNGTFDNFFFPSFSADGELIVFNAARGTWRGNPARGTGSRLMLTTSTGAWAVDLTAMNGGHVDLGITWPHWAPTISNDYYWVVFSSERDYGHRTTMATSPASCIANGVLQCKQIWLGAIAKNRLGAGMDPSAPPMWLPGQDPLANNISPYWSRPAVIQ